jgi:HD-like signal output (HDOD) protein
MNHPTLAHLIDSAVELRPLSGTAGTVLALSEGDRFSAQQLAEVVVSEPVLATRMLRIANSAFYGAPKRIASVREAIVLIGFPTVHATVLAMCLIETFPRSPEIDAGRFWRHSVSVATLAEELAKMGRAGTDHAFTGGIVHNIGRLAFARFEARGFRQAVACARATDTSVHEAQRALFGYTDIDLGAGLGERWGFPDSLIEALADSEPGSASAQGPIARAVLEARTVLGMLGVTDGVDAPAGLVEATPPAHWTEVTLRVDAFMEHVPV